MRVQTRIWPAHRSARHPEQACPLVEAPRATGVCLSGGSTRSYAAAVGILRGLTATGLISKVGYLSAVSGGAWAAAPYTFYRGAAASDADILGTHAAPHELSLERLERLDPRSLGAAASSSLAAALAQAAARHPSAPDQVWADAVGQVFLAPYGLFDPSRPATFTLDDRTAADIRSRNPALSDVVFHQVWPSSYRPYLLMHSTLSWPSDEADLVRSSRVGFEYAPLGVGEPAPLVLRREGHMPAHVGGYVEPFAFGGTHPRREGEEAFATVELPTPAFSLADAVGASSAFRAHERGMTTFPHVDYWPVERTGASGDTTRHVFTDGGDLENYGLIPLLRRGVRAIVVFINSVWPLSLDDHAERWPADLDVAGASYRPIDPFLAPLFGAPSRRFPMNQVFPEADYRHVVEALQEAKRAGGTVMTVSTHMVRSNDWWGVEGGWEARVCWVYNEQVDQWLRCLPEAVRQLVLRGRSPEGDGPFRRFPHYLTRGQNPGALTQLSPAQVNLLAHLSSWNVVEHRRTLEACLDWR